VYNLPEKSWDSNKTTAWQTLRDENMRHREV
jgi:hypothetical protein